MQITHEAGQASTEVEGEVVELLLDLLGRAGNGERLAHAVTVHLHRHLEVWRNVASEQKRHVTSTCSKTHITEAGVLTML